MSEADGSGSPVDGCAATIVLLRDTAAGPEVLLALRPDRGSFAGAWVFPGGSVDEADAAGEPIDAMPAARRAAVRETREEVGLVVAEGALVPLSTWLPPGGVAKRLATRFFLAAAPGGEAVAAPDELVAVEWVRPVDALERHAAGALTLFPPTWVTLHELVGAPSVVALLAAAGERGERRYATRFGPARTTAAWEEDAGYADPDAPLDADAPRHRLLIGELPWVYETSGIEPGLSSASDPAAAEDHG